MIMNVIIVSNFTHFGFFNGRKWSLLWILKVHRELFFLFGLLFKASSFTLVLSPGSNQFQSMDGIVWAVIFYESFHLLLRLLFVFSGHYSKEELSMSNLSVCLGQGSATFNTKCFSLTKTKWNPQSLNFLFCFQKNILHLCLWGH